MNNTAAAPGFSCNHALEKAKQLNSPVSLCASVSLWFKVVFIIQEAAWIA